MVVWKSYRRQNLDSITLLLNLPNIQMLIRCSTDILKFHTRTVPGVIEANHVDVDSFARGVGLVSLLGDKSDGDRKIEDLKLLYRAYVTNALASGHMQDNKYGFTKREKKKSFLKPLKILYVKVKFHLMHLVNIGLSPSKKMSERQKGMQISLEKPPHCGHSRQSSHPHYDNELDDQSVDEEEDDGL
ncbi:hypothetical protein P8452_04315 [Trifolium repens]|nr:hypothetical protein P8452_04315 [Trifolium repens]